MIKPGAPMQTATRSPHSMKGDIDRHGAVVTHNENFVMHGVAFATLDEGRHRPSRDLRHIR